MKYPKDRSAKIKPFKQWFRENHSQCKAGQPGCGDEVQVTKEQYNDFLESTKSDDKPNVHFRGHKLVV